MRFRLLQARNPDDPIRHAERASFAARLGVEVDDVLPFDAVTERPRAATLAAGVDGVLVGGSGDYSIFDEADWLPPFVDALGELVALRRPVFASCFGFQGLVMALGGHVARDEARAEVGTFDVHLTDAADDDPIFTHLPPSFAAQLGHKDHAVVWPEGVAHLARSERCEYQALTIPGAPIWGTQFHPELTHAENLGRFQAYEHHYRHVFGDDRYERMVESFVPSPHAEGLLARFAAVVRDGAGG